MDWTPRFRYREVHYIQESIGFPFLIQPYVYLVRDLLRSFDERRNIRACSFAFREYGLSLCLTARESDVNLELLRTGIVSPFISFKDSE